MKKSTWIVFGLAVILGVIYFVSREANVSVGVKQLKLPTFSEDKIDRVEVVGKNPVVLVKREDGWKVRVGEGDKAREVRADAESVKTLLDAATSLRAGHYVTNQKDKFAELGFDEDSAVTVKLLSNDKPELTLVLGKNASPAGRYARLPDEDDVYVVRGSFWQLTRNGANDFRNREIWPVKEDELKQLTIVKADGSELKIEKDEAGDFKFAAGQHGVPKDFRADRNLMNSLARTAIKLHASGFVDEPKTLGAPVLTLKADGQVVEIFADSNDKYLARRVGDEQLYEIAKGNIDRFNQPVESLRDLSVMKFDRGSIKEVTLKHGKDQAVVKKEENGWTVVQPKKLPEKFRIRSQCCG